MDVQYLKTIGDEKEYYVFIDSADHRLSLSDELLRSYSTVLKDKYGQIRVDSSQNPLREVDTIANRETFVHDYVVVFSNPFVNVISVEVIEAYIPTAPLNNAIQSASSDQSQNLLRYITVTCPEVDNNIKRNERKVDFATTMAKITWERLDDKTYIRYRKSYGKRYFHPVGRMQKLNFKFFKNNTNEHVNFGGSHHTMLVCITCLEPSIGYPNEYPLAPSYNPAEIHANFVSATAHSDDEL